MIQKGSTVTLNNLKLAFFFFQNEMLIMIGRTKNFNKRARDAQDKKKSTYEMLFTIERVFCNRSKIFRH